MNEKEILDKIKEDIQFLSDLSNINEILQDIIEIASYLNDEDIIAWAKFELSGYIVFKTVPYYRKVNGKVYQRRLASDSYYLTTLTEWYLTHSIGSIIENLKNKESKYPFTFKENTFYILVDKQQQINIIEGIKGKIREIFAKFTQQIKLLKKEEDDRIARLFPKEVIDSLNTDDKFKQEILEMIEEFANGKYDTSLHKAGNIAEKISKELMKKRKESWTKFKNAIHSLINADPTSTKYHYRYLGCLLAPIYCLRNETDHPDSKFEFDGGYSFLALHNLSLIIKYCAENNVRI